MSLEERDNKVCVCDLSQICVCAHTYILNYGTSNNWEENNELERMKYAMHIKLDMHKHIGIK